MCKQSVTELSASARMNSQQMKIDCATDCEILVHNCSTHEDVAPYSAVNYYRLFREIFSLQLHGRRVKPSVEILDGAVSGPMRNSCIKKGHTWLKEMQCSMKELGY